MYQDASDLIPSFLVDFLLQYLQTNHLSSRAFLHLCSQPSYSTTVGSFARAISMYRFCCPLRGYSASSSLSNIEFETSVHGHDQTPMKVARMPFNVDKIIPGD